MNKMDVIKEAVKRFKDNGDGIYFLYDDFLSGDAARLYVIKNKEVVSEAQPWSFETYNYYGNGSPCGIVPTLRSMIKENPEFTVNVANIANYTFSGEWKVTDKYVDTLKKYKIESKIIDIKDVLEFF